MTTITNGHLGNSTWQTRSGQNGISGSIADKNRLAAGLVTDQGAAGVVVNGRRALTGAVTKNGVIAAGTNGTQAFFNAKGVDHNAQGGVTAFDAKAGFNAHTGVAGSQIRAVKTTGNGDVYQASRDANWKVSAEGVRRNVNTSITKNSEEIYSRMVALNMRR